MFTPKKLTNKESFEKPSDIFYAHSVQDVMNGKIQKIPVTKMEKMGKFTWTETNVIAMEQSHQVLIESVQKADKPNPTAFQKIVQQINESSYKLVLTDMGKYGHGVFSCVDIPTDTYIASYSGRLMLVEDIDGKQDSGIYVTEVGEKICINARNHGNIARYFQHLPSTSRKDGEQSTLDFYTFKDETIKSRVATKNVLLQNIIYKNHILTLIKTTCTIPKGNIIGWDYNFFYWETLKLTPQLFLKNGQTIDQSEYKMNHIHITVKYSNLFLENLMPLEYVETQFKNKHEIVLGADGTDLLLTVSESMFNQKYNAKPYSLFHEFKKPNKVIIPHQVKAELNRISACLQLPGWNMQKMTAYVESSNSDNILLLGNYLQENGCKIEYLNDNTSLLVHYPESHKLQKIEALSLENQVRPQMG